MIEKILPVPQLYYCAICKERLVTIHCLVCTSCRLPALVGETEGFGQALKIWQVDTTEGGD